MHVGRFLHEERADILPSSVDSVARLSCAFSLLERRQQLEETESREQQHEREQREGAKHHAPDPFYRFALIWPHSYFFAIYMPSNLR